MPRRNSASSCLVRRDDGITLLASVNIWNLHESWMLSLEAFDTTNQQDDAVKLPLIGTDASTLPEIETQRRRQRFVFREKQDRGPLRVLVSMLPTSSLDGKLPVDPFAAHSSPPSGKSTQARSKAST